MFADDKNVVFANNKAKDLEFTMNKELKLVLKYCAIKKLSINLRKRRQNPVTKTIIPCALVRYEVIIIHSRSRWLFYHFISNAGSWNNCYIYIDERLQWEAQIQQKIINLRRT